MSVSVLRGWTWDPIVVSVLALTALLYAAGLVRMRRTALGSGWRPVAFALGWLTLVLALLSPVHKVSARLFSVHMTQHELLMLVAAPLLVMSKPMVLMLWGLPKSARLTIGHWTRAPIVHVSWQALTGPLTVWILHGLVLWIWHIPVLYEGAIANETVHAIQHTSFFAVAGLFWWALMYGRYGRMGYGVSVAYVFTTAMHTGLLGALITFASHVWYRTYDRQTGAMGLTAIEDQQVAGLIMWVPGGVVFTIMALALFAAWLGEAERRVQEGIRV